MKYLSLCLVIAFFANHRVHAQSGVTETSQRDAIIQGVTLWDKSIRSIETEEVLLQPGKEGGWTTLLKSGRGFVSPTCWYLHSRPIVERPASEHGSLYISATTQMLVVGSESTQPGMLKEPEALFYEAMKSQATMLGRWCDPVRQRASTELLSEGEVAYLPPDATSEYPGLQWRGKLAPEASSVALDLRVDPERGFVICSWIMHEPATGTIAAKMDNLRFEQHDGVWLPTLGVMTTWGRSSTTWKWEESKQGMLQVAVKLESLEPPVHLDPAHQAGIRHAIAETVARYRQVPAADQPWVNHPMYSRHGYALNPMIVSTKIVSLNSGFTALPTLSDPFKGRTIRDFSQGKDRKFEEVFAELNLLPAARSEFPPEQPPVLLPVVKPPASTSQPGKEPLK